MGGYPLVLTTLAHARCLVIGGGRIAERKVAGLLDAEAHPEVISPDLTLRLTKWRDKGCIVHHARTYQVGDLAGALLTIAATNDPSVNAAIAIEGAERGVLVNIVDDPSAGSFHTVATVRRGDLLLTASTSGASPALAALVRHDLAERYGPEYAALLELMRALRHGPVQSLSEHGRQSFWRSLALTQLLDWLRCNEREQAVAYLDQQIMSASATDHYRQDAL